MITRTKVYTLVTTIVAVVLFFFFFLGKVLWDDFSMLLSEVGTSHWAIWLGGIATMGLLGLLYFTWKVLRPSNPDKPSRFEKFLDGCNEKFWENLNQILFGTAAFAIFLIFIYKEWPARFLYLKPDTYMWWWALVAVGLALWPVVPKKFMNLFIWAYFAFLIIHIYDKWDTQGQGEKLKERARTIVAAANTKSRRESHHYRYVTNDTIINVGSEFSDTLDFTPGSSPQWRSIDPQGRYAVEVDDSVYTFTPEKGDTVVGKHAWARFKSLHDSTTEKIRIFYAR